MISISCCSAFQKGLLNAVFVRGQLQAEALFNRIGRQHYIVRGFGDAAPDHGAPFPELGIVSRPVEIFQTSQPRLPFSSTFAKQAVADLAERVERHADRKSTRL